MWAWLITATEDKWGRLSLFLCMFFSGSELCVYSVAGLFRSPLFCSTVSGFCVSINTRMPLSLKLCRMIWDHLLLYLHLCSLSLRLICSWSFVTLCEFLNCFFHIWKYDIGMFMGTTLHLCISFHCTAIICDIGSVNPRAWKFLLWSSVFFDLLLKCLERFINMWMLNIVLNILSTSILRY